MSSNPTPLPRQSVLPYCLRLWDLLSPACSNSSYAGSLRRWEAEVNDIEIVVLPAPEAERRGCPSVDLVLDRLLRSGYIQWDEVNKARGDKYKRFVIPALSINDSAGMGVDLYFANADNYGYRLLLSTGSTDFNHAMVTAQSKGGLRPSHLRCKDGNVWQQDPDGLTVLLPMPSENELFAAWGLPYVDPAERNTEKVHALRRALGLPYLSISRPAEKTVPATPTHNRLEAFA